MISLAIDTTGPVCSAAIYQSEDRSVLAQTSDETSSGHAEILMAVIATTLKNASTSYSAIGRVVVAAGPGSFTGIRIGIATARGLALGLGVPAVGVNVLEALCPLTGMETQSRIVLVAIDARRNETYCQFFTGQNDTGIEKVASLLPQGPFVANYDNLTAMISEIPRSSLAICGSGADGLNSRLDCEGRGAVPVLHRLAVAPIATIAQIGAGMNFDSPGPQPLYLRPADAKPQTEFVLERQ